MTQPILTSSRELANLAEAPDCMESISGGWGAFSLGSSRLGLILGFP